MNHRPSARPTSAAQRGVVLLFALIALVVLLIGAAALVRSFNTSLFMAGNIGFKRDLQNQVDRANAIALRAFNPTGGTGSATCAAQALSTRVLRQNDVPGCNYFASIRATVDAQSIPSVLTACTPPSSCPNGSGGTLNVISSATDATITDPSLTVVYVIDRLCASAGDEKTLGAASCALASQPPVGGDAANIMNAATAGTGLQPALPQSVLYRLSVLVTGPRNTRSFFQSTFSVSS